MKLTRKLVGLLMVLALVPLGAMPAFAAGEGSIKVTNTTLGETYNLYKIFDMSYDGTSPNLTNVKYTIDPDWNGFFVGGPGAAYLKNTQNAPGTTQLISIQVGADTKFLNITETNVKQFAETARAWIDANHPAVDATKQATATGFNAFVEFKDLDLGYYLVYPEGATPVIASLVNTTPKAEIKVKTEYEPIDKTVKQKGKTVIGNGKSVGGDIGTTVEFTAEGRVPDIDVNPGSPWVAPGAKYIWIITDSMSNGLTFNKDVAVTINGVTLDPKYYTVEYDTAAAVNPAPTNGFSLSVDMIQYLKDNPGSAHHKVQAVYTADINENAVVTETKNDIYLEYSTNPDGDTEKSHDENFVYVNRIKINKYDGQNTDIPVVGATFKLFKKDAQGNRLYYLQDPVSKKVTWVADKDTSTTVTTDAQGHAQFDGLDDGTYFLEEITTPDPYKVITNPIQVDVNHVTNAAGNPVGVDQEANVPNYNKNILPVTGGIGTTLFFVGGGLAAVLAVILLVGKKRARKVSVN